jgi:hypothetical protein
MNYCDNESCEALYLHNDHRFSICCTSDNCPCSANKDPVTLDLICKLIIHATSLSHKHFHELENNEKHDLGICLQKLYWLEPCGSNFWLSMLIHYEMRMQVDPDYFASFVDLS